jgi:hypothetical protein
VSKALCNRACANLASGTRSEACSVNHKTPIAAPTEETPSTLYKPASLLLPPISAWYDWNPT